MMLWHADGTDIDQMMLALSTYMGHAEISYTYWYLTAVPELMALAGGKFERFADLVGDGDEGTCVGQASGTRGQDPALPGVRLVDRLPEDVMIM